MKKKPSIYFPPIDLELKSGFKIDFTEQGDLFLNGNPIHSDAFIYTMLQLANMKVHIEMEENQPTQSAKINPIDKPCFIYFVKDHLSGLVKVGRAKNPQSRFTAMMTANPRITLLFYYGATEREEKRLHSKFNHLREYREWFRLSEDDVQGIYLESSQKTA